MRSEIYCLIAYGFYPGWLVAGGIDYLCHRRSDIEHTSGRVEGLFHVAQFATMAIVVLGIALFAPSRTLFILVTVAGVVHTVLSYADVRYTQPRRHISPLEQHAHGFMDVLPLAAIASWIVIEWSNADGVWRIALRDPALRPFKLVAVLFGIFVFGGVPVLEEFWRTLRVATRVRHQTGFATIK